MKIELTNEELNRILLTLPPGDEYNLLSAAIAQANQRQGGQKKRDYETFCKHYNYDPDAEKSREEFAEYKRQLQIFEQVPAPEPGPAPGM